MLGAGGFAKFGMKMGFEDVSDASMSLKTDRKASQAAFYVAARDDTTSVAESL